LEAVPLDPVCRLHERHDLSGFDCGVDSLNRWLVAFALSDQASQASFSYVAGRSGRVIGLYTLAPHAVDPADAGGRLSAGLPRRRPIPVLLLARLAVDRSEQGRGLGADLLRDGLRRCAGAADEIGGRAVVVHAKDEAAVGFYRRFGFVPLAENPQHLYVLMKDLRASIQAGQPR
jgi:predicted N-acetyltransferase YhbS